MKIVAGLGAIEDYEKLVLAGADEVFCGFVPLSWNMRFGNSLPLNRREVLFYHVQIGTMEDMRILQRMVQFYGVPVTITMNALYYTREQINVIAQYMQELAAIGFQEYIVADLNLVRYLCENNVPVKIHLSGEIGEWNTPSMKMFQSWFQKNQSACEITRVIFHRKNSISEMSQCVLKAEEIDFAHEFEAFSMNERCHYTGGYCNSLHADEILHLCQVDYRLTTKDALDGTVMETNDQKVSIYEGEAYVPGQSGCAMCALWKLQHVGITHLKVVGRGQNAECMVKDVKALKKALRILEQVTSEEQYMNEMKKDIFPNGCSLQCYYPS